MQVENKVIVVTGASGGIGKELCRELHRRHARLLMVGKNEVVLNALNAELGNAHAVLSLDLSKAEERARLVTTCEREEVAGLINLAGMLDFNEFSEQTPELIEQTIAVNLVAPMLITRELLGQLKSRPESFVLNVGSVFGSIGHPGFVAYCSSKAGLKSFSESLERELSDSPVKVLHIAPRATRTGLNGDRVNALNQVLGNKSDTPAYVARRIVKQIETENAQIVLGWPEKLFVLVNALLPGVVRGALARNLSTIKQYARA